MTTSGFPGRLMSPQIVGWLYTIDNNFNIAIIVTSLFLVIGYIFIDLMCHNLDLRDVDSVVGIRSQILISTLGEGRLVDESVKSIVSTSDREEVVEDQNVSFREVIVKSFRNFIRIKQEKHISVIYFFIDYIVMFISFVYPTNPRYDEKCKEVSDISAVTL